MGKSRMAAIAIAVAVVGVSAPVAVRWAAAQSPAGDVFHVGLSKDLRVRIKIEPIKHPLA